MRTLVMLVLVFAPLLAIAGEPATQVAPSEATPTGAPAGAAPVGGTAPSAAAQPAATPPRAGTPDLNAFLAGELEYGRTLIGFARPRAGRVQYMMAFQGAYDPRPLDGAAFYQAIGRDDLVPGWKARRILRVALPIIGGAGALASLFALAYLPNSAAGRRDDILVAAPAIGLILSVALTLTPVFIRPDPMQAEEARQAVDEHNQELRRRLGLPGPEILRGGPNPPSLSITPWVAPTGGGLSTLLVF